MPPTLVLHPVFLLHFRDSLSGNGVCYGVKKRRLVAFIVRKLFLPPHIDHDFLSIPDKGISTLDYFVHCDNLMYSNKNAAQKQPHGAW
jgi:hypothetical protein